MKKNPEIIRSRSLDSNVSEQPDNTASLSGNLEHFNLIDLLNTLAARGSSGELRIHAGSPAHIWIDQGRIALAAPTGLSAQLENIGMPDEDDIKDGSQPAIFPGLIDKQRRSKTDSACSLI